MRRYHSVSFNAAADEAPFSELNTTPLIDVMLVLLIMFIITIPISTHKLPLDLPAPKPGLETKPVVHRLNLDAAGRISLDGAAVRDAELPARLNAIAGEQMSELQLHTHAEARYERFDQVLAAIKRAGIQRMGMVGNERFAEVVR
jgi:biopolymer transport protein ExbD